MQGIRCRLTTGFHGVKGVAEHEFHPYQQEKVWPVLF